MATTRSGIDRPLAHRSANELALAGLEDGLLAGLVMLLFVMLGWTVIGDTPATPLRLVASTFLGPGALLRDHLWLPLVLGALIHFGLSVAFSEVFASLLGPSTLRRATFWGVVYGLAVGVLMRFVVLPVVNPALALTSLPMFFFAHLLYGLGLAFFPVFLRAPERARPRPAAARRARYAFSDEEEQPANVTPLPRSGERGERRPPLH